MHYLPGGATVVRAAAYQADSGRKQN